MADLSVVFREILPRRVKLGRLKGDLSQRQLAKRAGLAVATVCEIEGGLIQDLKVTTLRKLCAALGEHPNFLLGYDSAANKARAFAQQLCRDAADATQRNELRRDARQALAASSADNKEWGREILDILGEEDEG